MWRLSTVLQLDLRRPPLPPPKTATLTRSQRARKRQPRRPEQNRDITPAQPRPQTTASRTGHPLTDLLILSGGRLFQLLSKGDGTFASKELKLPGYAVEVEAVDLNGDGIDDARVTLRGGKQYLLYGHAGQGGEGGLDPSDPIRR